MDLLNKNLLYFFDAFLFPIEILSLLLHTFAKLTLELNNESTMLREWQRLKLEKEKGKMIRSCCIRVSIHRILYFTH